MNKGGKNKKSAVILPEERGYMEEERGLILRKSAVIFPEERGYIFVMKIMATFVSACSQGQRTHSARTNNVKENMDKIGKIETFYSDTLASQIWPPVLSSGGI